MVTDRRLWIDTTGQPVITTTPNGVKNARRWGWTEAQAVPIDDADHEKAVRERIARDIEELEHTAAQVRDLVRAGKPADWPNGWDSAVYAAARIAREGA